MSRGTKAKRKSQLGQFLTPATTARFMAGLFPPVSGGECRLLDPGAGIGSLSSAFLERCTTDDLKLSRVEATAFELDESLHRDLDHTLAGYANQGRLGYEIVGGDFVEEAVNRIQFDPDCCFTHAILNPPYKKINSDSRHRRLLREVGIETVNLYSAFVALSLMLMASGGQMVAIVPRSFCNGLYYRPFRNVLLKHAAIRHLHLFASRNKAFRDDDVLQENLIIRLERDGQQGPVTVSTSTDDSFSDLITHEHPFDRIVFPNDPERFIHVPVSPEQNTLERLPTIRHSLVELGISVSTGPVVDFRLKEHLCDMPKPGTAPLLYPGHFSGYDTEWPKLDFKKPNAIWRNPNTEKWLYPNGFYCVVRRFSAKEEKRRIVARVVNPATFEGAPVLGFENHLNVFHDNKRGLTHSLAAGLATFLNTTAVDEYFRCFNGHTQVNATDLKRMKYPSRETLAELGEWMMDNSEFTQSQLDETLDALVK